MMVRRQDGSATPFRLLLWSRTLRWVSALALVVALTGLNVTAAQAGSVAERFSATDGSQVTLAGQLSRLDVVQDDMDDKEAAEDEEYEEDGLLPTGQGEQRAQSLGDKTEAKDEDHDN